MLLQANNRQKGTDLSVTLVAGKSAQRANHSVRTYALIKERKKERILAPRLSRYPRGITLNTSGITLFMTVVT